MTAQAWKPYNGVYKYIGDGTIELTAGDGHFACVLATSGYVPADSHDTYGDVSANEVAAGNGYTTGGKVLANTSWTLSGATATFDADDPAWTSSADGTLSARTAVLVHIAAGAGAPTASDKLIARCLLDDKPADVIAANGGPLVVKLAASGFVQIGKPAS